MRYEEVLKKWLADQRTYQKYSTYTCYANIVENHLMPHLGQLEEVTTDIVQDFALRLLESGNRVAAGGNGSGNVANTKQNEWNHTAYDGGNGLHNNVQPYQVIYAWRRTG